MPEVDGALLARARGRTPADPAVRECWDAVVLGIVGGTLAAGDVRRLVGDLRAGRGAAFRHLTFVPAGDDLHVDHFGRVASCRTAAMCAELARLVAPPVAAASLVAAAIGWVHTGDGELPYRARLDGRNLLVRVNDFPAEPVYTLIADCAELADLEDWPPSWHRPPLPEHPPAQARRRPVGIGRVRVWSEELCRFAAGSPADVVAALGIAGTVLAGIGETATVEPPPPGTAGIRLDHDGDRIGTLTVTFSGVTLTRADFDAYFGHGMWLPRVHWDDPHRCAYHVEVPGGTSSCTVFPSFAEEPTDTAVASGVKLRLDRP